MKPTTAPEHRHRRCSQEDLTAAQLHPLRRCDRTIRNSFSRDAHGGDGGNGEDHGAEPDHPPRTDEREQRSWRRQGDTCNTAEHLEFAVGLDERVVIADDRRHHGGFGDLIGLPQHEHDEGLGKDGDCRWQRPTPSDTTNDLSAIDATITARCPPHARSMRGPSNGATTTNGAMVSSRPSRTRSRPSAGSTLKNSDPASPMASIASPPIPTRGYVPDD